MPYSVWCLGSDIYSWANRPLIRGQIARVLNCAAQVFGDGNDLCQRVQEWLNVGCRFLPSYRPLDGELPLHPPSASQSPRFLYLGRVHSAKGVSELFDGFAIVSRRLPGATLRIVGDGPDFDRLKTKAQQVGLGRAVSFAGSVGRAEIVAAYRDCDFVVIPTKSDSLPLVFSEAIQAYRPVIGTDVGDLGAFIRRFHLGVVCDDASPQLLAAAMQQMADQPVFSIEGRARLLKLLDPGAAAIAFCRSVFGAQFAPAKPALPRDHTTSAIDAGVAARP
jgi:glycosyltransferase involved in cell wall biosynthesis